MEPETAPAPAPATQRYRQTRPYTQGGFFSDTVQARVVEAPADAELPHGAVLVAPETPCHDWQIQENN